MATTILTTRFNFSMPAEQLKKIMPEVAPAFSDIPGCCWKIWLIDEERKESGGVYLFESATASEQFLKCDLFASVANNPAFSHLQTHTCGVMEAASLLTGGPLLKTVKK